MIVSVCFTNFGPYHLARLRALADAPGASRATGLIAYEVAGPGAALPLGPRRPGPSRSSGSRSSPTGPWRSIPGATASGR